MTDSTTTTTIPTAIELAAAIRDGRATVEARDTELAWNCGAANCGAVWPDTVIDITLGDWSVAVPVWLVAGYGDGNQYDVRPGEWYVESSDGCFRGDPRVTVDEGDEDDGEPIAIDIHGGDNISFTLRLDAGYSYDDAATAAVVIEDALSAAYEAITVSEPDASDIDLDDAPRTYRDTYYVLLRDGASAHVAEIEIVQARHPIIAAAEMDDDCGAPSIAGVMGHPLLDDILDSGATVTDVMDALRSRLEVALIRCIWRNAP